MSSVTSRLRLDFHHIKVDFKKSEVGTVVQQTARPYSGQWTQLQRSSVPLSPPSWTFSLHDAPVKLPVSWRTPPILPTVSSSSCHQEDGTRASEPAPPGCSTAFPPPITSPPSETSSTTLAPETRIPSPIPPHHTTPHAPHHTTPHHTHTTCTTWKLNLKNIVQFWVCWTKNL